MADAKQINDWLDAADDSPLPNFSDAKAAGDWLDAPDTTAAPSFKSAKDINSFLDAPDTAATPPATEAPANHPRGFMAALESTLAQTPETYGAGLEAVGNTTGISPLTSLGGWFKEHSGQPVAGFEQQHLQDIRGIGDAWNYVKELTGSALGSMAPTLAAGLAGAAAGGLAAGPAGAAVGGVGGAAVSGVPLNIGDMSQQLMDEGVDKPAAEKAASIVGSLISIPDVASTVTLSKPFVKPGLEVVEKGAVRMIADAVKHGATVEGATEAVQQLIQEGTAALMTGNLDGWNRMVRVFESGLGGALGGGITGGAGAGYERVRGNSRPEGGSDEVTSPAETGTAPAGPRGPAPDVGSVVGLTRKNGAPQRVVIEGVQDGYVFARNEDGQPVHATVDDFLRDMTQAPPPSGKMNDTTTVPPMPADAESVAAPQDTDINDFNPWEMEPEQPKAPPAPSPQGSMALPDTTAVDRALSAARTLRKNAAEAERIAATGAASAKSPDEIALMHRQAAALEQEALQRRRDTGAKAAGAPEQLPALDTDRGRLGQLGVQAPEETEASTGQSLTQPGSPAKRADIAAARERAPLLQQQPDRSEATEGPNALTDVSRGRLGDLGMAEPAQSEASTGQSLTQPGSPAKKAKPLDILQAVAQAGGLKDETAARYDNTAAGRAKKRGGELDFLYTYPEKGGRRSQAAFIPGSGPRSVINNKRGLSADYMREHLIQHGYLPDGATVDDMYEALRRSAAGDRQYAVHGANSDINDVLAMREREADEQAADRLAAQGPHPEAQQELAAEGSWFGPEPTLEDLDALDALIGPDMLRALDLDQHEGLMRRIDEAAGPAVTSVAREGTHDGDIAERPAEEGHAPAERLSPGVEEQEADAGTAGAGEAGGRDAGEAESGAGETREPLTERTDQGDQVVMPGMERSARQAAAARPERLRAGVEQKAADEGLFGEDPRRQLRLEQSGATTGQPGHTIDLRDQVQTEIRRFTGAQPATVADAHMGAISFVEQHGRATGTEASVVLDGGGNIISATTDSLGGEVAITPNAAFLDPKANVSIIHNHPNTTALSAEDLGILGFPGIKHITAVADGQITSASINPAIQRKLNADPALAAQQITRIAGLVRDRLTSIYLNHLQSGMNIEDVNRDMPDAVNQVLHDAGLINYKTTLQPYDEIRQAVQPELTAYTAELDKMFRTGFKHATSPAPYRRTGFADINSALREILGGNADAATGRSAGAARDQSGQAGNGQGSTLAEQQLTVASGLDPIQAYRAARDFIQDIGKRLRLNPKKDGSAPEIAAAAMKDVPLSPPITPHGEPRIDELGAIGRFLAFASSIASRDKPSAEYYAADLGRERRREYLERQAGDYLKRYAALPQDGIDRISKILEHDRLTGYDREDVGRRAVARMPENYTGRLAKPGEIVLLNPAETAALHDLRAFFDQRLGQIGEAMAGRVGYRGAFTQDAIQAAIDGATHPRERTAAVRAQEILQMIDDARRKGYVPFQRYGNKAITVRPKPGYEPGKDGLQHGKPAWFELVDTSRPLSSVFGGSNTRKLQERVAALRKEFPADKYDITVGNAGSAVQNVDIPALEKLFVILNQNDPALGDKLYDQVMLQVYNEAKAGFKKQANNIPGYSTDFERAIADYARQSSSVVANMEMGRQVDEAYNRTQDPSVIGDRRLRDYWKAYRNHLESGGNDYAKLRQLGFFQFLWGSPAAALVNLTQTPLVTSMQLGSWAGPRALPLAHGAMLEGLGAIRTNPRGLTINWDQIGKTPAEKAMIKQLRAEGVLDPAIAQDLQGADASKSQQLRPLMKKVQRVYDVGASGFNVAEQANRIAAALSAFRAAQNPQLLAKAQKVYGQDALWQEMVGRHPTPENVARFMVDETQFVGGKRGRLPAMRGAGALLFQFKQYPANYLRLLNKNFNRMGPEGKIAGTLMLAGMAMGAGFTGLPFVEDATKLAEAMIKGITGIDPMINYRLASLIRDLGGGEIGAEMFLHGASREMLGIDLGNRIGMGSVAPELDWGNLAPLLAATVGRGDEAYQRWKAGQPLGAIATGAQFLAGKGPSDLIRGLGQLPQEGYQTRYGDLVIPPSEITMGERIAKGTGFQPSELAREGEFRQTQKRLRDATQGASSSLITNIAKNFALADDARRNGDEATARAYEAAADRLYQDNQAQLSEEGIPDWRKVPAPSRAAIKNRIRSMLDFDNAVLARAGKGKREAMQDYPLPRQ